MKNLVTAYEAVKNIKGLTFGLFGYRPTAFYNCAFDEVVLRRTFGINVEETDLKVVFDRMEELPEEVVKEDRKKQKSCGTQQKYRKVIWKIMQDCIWY